MDRKSTMELPRVAGSPDVSKLPEQYGCGTVRLAGAHDSLYERHLLFDNVVDRDGYRFAPEF
jgi:starch phosphorylase